MWSRLQSLGAVPPSQRWSGMFTQGGGGLAIGGGPRGGSSSWRHGKTAPIGGTSGKASRHLPRCLLEPSQEQEILKWSGPSAASGQTSLTNAHLDMTPFAVIDRSTDRPLSPSPLHNPRKPSSHFVEHSEVLFPPGPHSVPPQEGVSFRARGCARAMSTILAIPSFCPSDVFALRDVPSAPGRVCTAPTSAR